jgi:hypothetical protein
LSEVLQDEDTISQEEGSIPKEQPFERATPGEFFQMCNLAGGQVEQWDDGWACNYEEEEDILCMQSGDCTFGTAPEITTPSYSSTSATLLIPEESQALNEVCGNEDGTFFEWNTGYGCDFEEEPDIFCDQNDLCGLGWVIEIAGSAPIQIGVSDLETYSPPTSLIANMLQPAFLNTIAEGDQRSTNSQEDFIRALSYVEDEIEDFSLEDLLNVEITTAGAVAFAADDGDEGGDESSDTFDSWDEEECTVTSGNHYPVPDEPGWTTCDFDDGSRIICYLGWPSHCEYFPNVDESIISEPGGDLEFTCGIFGCFVATEDPDPDVGLDFGNFQEIFLSTEVYFVLGGISDLEPQFKNFERDWNGLYSEIASMNGIVGQNVIVVSNTPVPEGPIVSNPPSPPGVPIPYPNLPGIVSIIAPKNIVGPNNMVGPNIGPLSIVAPNNAVGPNIGPLNFVDTSTAFDEADALFGKRTLVMVSKPFGSTLDKTTCGILSPPLCWPEVGIMIPATQLNYFVNPSDLPMPDEFNWVDEFETSPEPLDPTSTSKSPTSTASNTPESGGPEGETTVDEPVTADATVLGRNADGTWVYVRLPGGRECWVWEGTLTEDSDFDGVEILPDPPTPTFTPSPTLTLTPTPTPTLTPAPITGSISGTVFKDTNGDGSNSGDSGYAGAAVTLGVGPCNSSGLANASSNGSGGFSFTGLSAGTYCLTVVPPVVGSCPRWDHASTSTKFTFNLSAGQAIFQIIGFDNSSCEVD